MRAAKIQASLRIRAVSPEPPLLAHTSSESRGTFRQKVRSMAPLNGWACAVKIYHDGMLEDTNSLDGAQLWTTVTERPRQNWCTTTVHVLSYKLAVTYLQCVLSISLSQLVAMMTSDKGALGSNSRYSFLFFAFFFFFFFFLAFVSFEYTAKTNEFFQINYTVILFIFCSYFTQALNRGLSPLSNWRRCCAIDISLGTDISLHTAMWCTVKRNLIFRSKTRDFFFHNNFATGLT